ncbi:MAG TPA: AAA-like domain-containing protein [Fimbriimonas sp.]|nr:AAA-like domain-containing protein [Fimbriimonas sp.]
MSVVADGPQESFFVSGGTIPPGSPSYIERAADRELLEALLGSEYAYVLNSRQMGKSSLAVRTIQKLQDAGVATGFVDLTRLGSTNVTAEQWYSGLLMEIGRSLGLRSEAAMYIRDQKELGPSARILGFLQDVVLTKTQSAVVLLIDEIDVTRSLPFATGELFAGIRQLHNGRASSPEMKRLTVCLMGSALPGSLIEDVRTTPFNVGRRIELRDFTLEEAMPLAAGLGEKGVERLKEVMDWTNGHPYLTQALCADYAKEPGDVSKLVAKRYLGQHAVQTDSNLADVGNRLLGQGDPTVTDQIRADTLTLFLRMLKSGVPDDETNEPAARIKMSGVARVSDGRLEMRNAIYRHVFSRTWVRENMPAQEVRRQRQAFWRGVARSTLGTAAVGLALIGFALTVKMNLNRVEARARALQNQNGRLQQQLDDYRLENVTLRQSLARSRRRIEWLQGQLTRQKPPSTPENR